MAENGDTYDFFKISYQLSQGNFIYDSKRLPLYSILLTPFNPNEYVFYGRIINNLIYFISIFLFYKLISFKFKLESYEKLLFTLIFAFNFVIFDNSFFILADSLFLMLSILFLYLYEKKFNIYLLGFVSLLAFYTRFEGIILVISLSVILFFQSKYKEILKLLVLFAFLSLPLIIKILLTSQATYLSDQAGFTLSFTNILKSFGSLLFGTGGFWLLSLFILDKKTIEIAKNPSLLIKFFKINIYFIIFTLTSLLLILWGFYLRLYTVLIFLSILYFINIIKAQRFTSFKLWIPLLSISLFILNVQILDHFDLSYFKLSKITSIIFSLGVLALLFLSKKSYKFKLFLTGFIICLINIIIFTEKFTATKDKYFTIVQAAEFIVSNNLQNVAYFDESGVQKWYFKDFDSRYQFFINPMPLKIWILENNIEYLMITDEMGYYIASIKENRAEINSLEVVKEFNSDYSGGRTRIIKVDLDKIQNFY